MVILCNYLSLEVLQAFRHVNSLELTAHLGEVLGEVMTNFISQMADTKAPLMG